ncbi:MAG: serine O-acetyltransferase [Clostridia bacterium]|nr:serine O-acetyltransferase [Clostridia bacterium]
MASNFKLYMDSIKKRDPAVRSTFEILLLYSGVHAVFNHRIAHFLFTHKLYFLARLVSQLSRFFTGIEIHPGAKIGRRLFIDHGSGVIIGETTEIGDDCTIFQGVTLGGTGKDSGKRHPTLGNNITVGSGSRILGPVHIGDNTKIAANAVVLNDIPDDCTVVGIPAEIVRIGGKRIVNHRSPKELLKTINYLKEHIEYLEKEIDELKSKHN